jgi:hypothetical protein
VLSSTPLQLIGSRPLVAFGNETYKLNLKNWKYKYDNYTINLVGRSFGRCLRNRLLLSGCAMRFATRSYGCALRRAPYWELQRRISSLTVGGVWVLVFLCFMWKPYPRVVFRKPRLVWVLYMRSLLLVESFDLGPSNQYILVRGIPSCFRFAKMCLCQVSLLSEFISRYLTSSGSCTLIIWTGGWGGHISLRVVNVTWSDLDALAFILNFFKQFRIAATLVCCFS